MTGLPHVAPHLPRGAAAAGPLRPHDARRARDRDALPHRQYLGGGAVVVDATARAPPRERTHLDPRALRSVVRVGPAGSDQRALQTADQLGELRSGASRRASSAAAGRSHSRRGRRRRLEPREQPVERGGVASVRAAWIMRASAPRSRRARSPSRAPDRRAPGATRRRAGQALLLAREVEEHVLAQLLQSGSSAAARRASRASARAPALRRFSSCDRARARDGIMGGPRVSSSSSEAPMRSSSCRGPCAASGPGTAGTAWSPSHPGGVAAVS